jgi:hypothetical protein
MGLRISRSIMVGACGRSVPQGAVQHFTWACPRFRFEHKPSKSFACQKLGASRVFIPMSPLASLIPVVRTHYLETLLTRNCNAHSAVSHNDGSDDKARLIRSKESCDLRDFFRLSGSFDRRVFPCFARNSRPSSRKLFSKFVTTSPAPTAFTRTPCSMASSASGLPRRFVALQFIGTYRTVSSNWASWLDRSGS